MQEALEDEQGDVPIEMHDVAIKQRPDKQTAWCHQESLPREELGRAPPKPAKMRAQHCMLFISMQME